jgi:hypothetical protein|nr:MAG TPA: hypothetical protein [Caudoviricetes sp.]
MLKCVELVYGASDFGSVTFKGKTKNGVYIKRTLIKKFLKGCNILGQYVTQRNGICYITIMHDGKFNVDVNAYNVLDNFVISELLKLGAGRVMY